MRAAHGVRPAVAVSFAGPDTSVGTEDAGWIALACEGGGGDPVCAAGWARRDPDGAVRLDSGLARALEAVAPDARWICHGAEGLEAARQWIGAARIPSAVLDVRDLAMLCRPASDAFDLVTLSGSAVGGLPAGGVEFASDSDPGGVARRLVRECLLTLTVWERLAALAAEMPAALIAELVGLLLLPKHRELRSFLAECRDRSTGSGASRVADLFRENARTPEKRPVPPADQCESVDAEWVADALGPCGGLAREMGSYERRDGQVQMARAVAESLNRGGHLMVEAGTGTGKSLAYIVPCAAWAVRNRTPVVLSTNTKNLQSQLFTKDLPLVRRSLGLEFRAAILKGRLNYVCVRRLLHLVGYAETELDPDERLRVARALSWAARSETGDLSEIGAVEGGEMVALAGRLSCAGEECLGRFCRRRRACFVRRARAEAMGADVIVANHALVFAELSESSPALPPYEYAVFDEAHNIEEAATTHFSIEVSMPRFAWIANRLRREGRRGRPTGLLVALARPAKKGAAPWDAAARAEATARLEGAAAGVADLRATAERFFTALGGYAAAAKGPTRIDGTAAGSERWRHVLDCREETAARAEAVIRAVEDLAALLRKGDGAERDVRLEFLAEIDGVVASLRELLQHMDFVLAAADPDYVYWIEPLRERRPARAWAAPVEVGLKLAESLYRRKRSLVFCSATLAVRGSFEFLKERLGIRGADAQRVGCLNVGTPFDYERQCAVGVPLFLPEPTETDGAYEEGLAELLADAFRLTRGRALALFTSFEMLRRVAEPLAARLRGEGIDVLTQGVSGTRERLIETLRQTRGSVVLGTHSFWEGVDIAGDALVCVVVARLPFAVHTDPIVAARCERITASGGNAFVDYALPSAVIRFRQGFGRLIRHRADRGIVVVADRRLMTKRYGAWFRRSLPCPVTAFENRAAFLTSVEEFFGGAG